MTLVPWIDAAYAPTAAEAAQAHAEGYRACGFYLPGVAGTDPLNVWTPAQVDVLRSAGIAPVPIVVPDPALTADPAAAAEQAWAQTTGPFGLPTRCSILYSGNHLEATGQITGPIWIPAPGGQPATIGAGSAVQWGQTAIAGWSVDLDSAAADFPLDAGIVVDFEFNTVGGAAGVAWYQTFQSRVAALAAATPSPDPPEDPMPDRVYYVYTTTGKQHIVNIDRGWRIPVDTPGDGSGFTDASPNGMGLPIIRDKFSDAEMESIPARTGSVA